MIEDKPDNPMAFPVPSAWAKSGMTLRDYFAAKAMAALIQSPNKHWYVRDGVKIYAESNDSLTVLAYIHADSMLKAREK